MSDESADQPENELDALRANLRNLRMTLDEERNKAHRQLFDNFLQEVLKMDADDPRSETLRQAYITIVKTLADESVPMGERMSIFINSDFLYSVLTHKNLRYEREVKRFLGHLNELLVVSSRENATKDYKFWETLFSQALGGVLDLIEPENANNHEHMAEMIVSAIGESSGVKSLIHQSNKRRG